MILWLRLPLICATKPTRQLSCSNSGRYNPWAGGRPVLFGLRMLAVLMAQERARRMRRRVSVWARRVDAVSCRSLLQSWFYTAVSRLAPLAYAFFLLAGSCDAGLSSRGPQICRGVALQNRKTGAGLVPTSDYMERPDAASIASSALPKSVRLPAIAHAVDGLDRVEFRIDGGELGPDALDLRRHGAVVKHDVCGGHQLLAAAYVPRVLGERVHDPKLGHRERHRRRLPLNAHSVAIERQGPLLEPLPGHLV